jgi:dihydroorotate dehydrogenase
LNCVSGFLYSQFSLVANKTETGGLSGVPLKPLSLRALSILRSHLPSTVPLIGCGGITSGADALEFARAGASLVQIYTAFGYGGPGTPRRIKDELAALLKEQGTTWAEVVKTTVKERALAPPPATGEEGVKQLIVEAEHLRDLLDHLGKDI